MKVEMFESLQSGRAEKLLESLRKGIPPAGFVEAFTVGRKDEIEWLDRHLIDDETYSLLLKANYGAGKTHLLQWIREKALRKRFGVSLLALDSKSGVRFNRMDQIFGVILRNIQVPLSDGTQGGLERTLDLLAKAAERARNDNAAPGHEFWKKVTNDWQWYYSKKLKSPPLYIAFRAWVLSDSPEIRQTILDWLTFPNNYRKTELKQKLVEGLRRHFRGPGAAWKFRAGWEFLNQKEDPLVFHYHNCWAALEDIHRMLVASSMTGMAILFDEFEDVLTNLNNIKYQENAFINLFQFMSGDCFTGKTFFAVTPDFVRKCKVRLMVKGRWGFEYSQFDKLKTFSMSPLLEKELLKLAARIVWIHEIAYGYECSASVIEEVKQHVRREASSAVQDRTRQAIKGAVQVLDDALEE